MSTSTASSRDMHPVIPVPISTASRGITKKGTATTTSNTKGVYYGGMSEAELIKLIQLNVGGPAGLSILDNPADVRKAVIDALARIVDNATDAERIRLGDLNPKERRIVRTVTNRGAAVRSRLRQRKELDHLRQQLKLKEDRVTLLERALTQALAANRYYNSNIPPAVLNLLPDLVLPPATTTLVKQEPAHCNKQHMYPPCMENITTTTTSSLCYQEQENININTSNTSAYNSPICHTPPYNRFINNQVAYDREDDVLPATTCYPGGSPISSISAASLKHIATPHHLQLNTTTTPTAPLDNNNNINNNIHALEQLISQNNNNNHYNNNNLFV